MMIQGEDEISPIILQSRILQRHDRRRCSLTEESAVIHYDDEIKEDSTVFPVVSNFSHYKQRMRRKRFLSHSTAIADQPSMIWRPPPDYYKVFKYTIPSLIGLVAVKFQGKSEDPFKANPAPSWSSLAAFCMHSVIVLIIKQFQYHPTRFMQFLSRVEFASAVVASLSLISLLLPDSSNLVLLYISWILFTIISGWPKFQFAYNWLLERIKTVSTTLLSFFASNMLIGPNVAQQQPQLSATEPPV
ncbi:hypothetical protein ACH5RR_000367 [Cinchona calisaya]|uniref:Uncharacterized protein n=1 Tax=Cinchona calisaya TaxID=153742 RepID=A0ABD3B0N6_9GENT